MDEGIRLIFCDSERVYLNAAIRLALQHGFTFDEILEQFTRDFDGKSFSLAVEKADDIYGSLAENIQNCGW